MVKDPYEVLGIKRGASKAEIKSVYRKLVSQYHPDKYSDNPLQDLAQEKLKEINDAYNQIMGGDTARDSYQRESSSQRERSYQGSSNLYQQVRYYINQRRLQEADTLLRQVKDKTAEWFFLQGILLSHKGFYQQAFSHIERAYTMNPQNTEYQRAFLEMQRASQQPRYQQEYRPAQSNECDCCSICSALYCLNCLCECLGGC